MAPLVRSCCCGCNLHTGTILIAVFELLGSVYGMYTNFKEVHDFNDMQDEQASVIGEVIRLVLLYQSLSSYIAIAYAGGVVAVLSFVMSLILIAAANYETRAPILAWLIWKLVMFAASFALAIFLGVSYSVSATITALIFAWMLEIYFLIVVYSYNQSLLEEDQNGGARSTNPAVVTDKIGQSGTPPYERLDEV